MKLQELSIDRFTISREEPTKWMWMMEWCKKRGFPPANEYFWGLADKAFSERFCKDK